MTVEEMKEETGITLKVQGRIDTNTSVQLQDKLLKALQKTRELTLDLEGSDYVSSAGLRTFLIAQKTAMATGGTFKLRHVNPEVGEVLDKSGFSKIITIEV